MNFSDYQSTHDCRLLRESEQSIVFLVEKGGRKYVCKKYPNPSEKKKEETAYFFVLENNLLNVPNITAIGPDYLEIEYIEKAREPTKNDAIRAMLKLYSSITPISREFQSANLSLEKVLARIEYIPQEMRRVEIEDQATLRKIKEFADREYDDSPHRCFVHGDLKSPHIIPSSSNLFCIDLGLFGQASPWYDLAFLYMEQPNKEKALDEITEVAYMEIGKIFGVTKKQTRHYLKSAIFFRTLYDLIYALRHRPRKSVERILKELNIIIDEK